MIKEIENFERKELFEHYNSCDNPFIIVTTKINITNVVNYCKEHKNMYATLGYLITKTVNQIDNFKYRYKDGKIYYCEEVKSNYTQMYGDNKIGYFNVDYKDSFSKYMDEFLLAQKKFLEDGNCLLVNGLDEVWLSCSPWFKFTHLITPFSKENSIPQFIWDKYDKVDNEYYVDLMIMIHHGFADGYHIGKFLEILEENIRQFN